jgi:hypothetical protein
MVLLVLFLRSLYKLFLMPKSARLITFLELKLTCFST